MITTHVLDTARGRPAANILVQLDAADAATPGGWRLVADGKTDADGRCRTLVAAGATVPPGVYRLRFETGAHAPEGFYPYVDIVFTVRDSTHHHVPLLLSPFGYSTYRGS
jgi:5-hydroxyisourate hydrolase